MNTDQGTMCNLSAFRAALLISLGAFTYLLLLVYYPEIQRSVSLGLSVNASFAAEKAPFPGFPKSKNDLTVSLTVLDSTLIKSRSSPTISPSTALPITSTTTISVPTPQTATTSVNNSRHCAPFPLTFDPHAPLFYCDWDTRSPASCDQRLRAALSCSKSSADVIYEWVSLTSSPSVYQYTDKCLQRVIKERCYDRKVIPRLMNFVSFNQRDLPFYGMLSVVSAVRFVQPCLVLFHGDYLPTGRYWNTLVNLIPNILHVNRSIPTSIFGHEIKVIEHSTDVARLEVMKNFGGVYMDTDHILLNPLDSLRNYSVVMGVEIPGQNFGNGMFMGKPNAKFFDVWYDAYQSFNDNEWAIHSTIMPYRLHSIFPLVDLHVVDTFFKPDYSRIRDEFYKNKYNWTNLYGMHLYVRMNKEFFEGRLESQKSSLGEITRHVLFGDSAACVNTGTLVPVRRT